MPFVISLGYGPDGRANRWLAKGRERAEATRDRSNAWRGPLPAAKLICKHLDVRALALAGDEPKPRRIVIRTKEERDARRALAKAALRFVSIAAEHPKYLEAASDLRRAANTVKRLDAERRDMKGDT